MKTYKTLTATFIIITGFLILGPSCKKEDDSKASLYKGAAVKMGNGQANSFVRTDDSGVPIEVGITLTSGALQNLPDDPMDFAGSTFVLTLPAEISVPPFDHITANWNPMGHEPTTIYDLPHFDFHFYLQTVAEQMAIPPYEVDSTGFKNLPDKAYFPSTYIPFPGGVPAMGVHWGDPTSHEFTSHDFDATLIFGSYNGKLTFIEPMITKAAIESKQNKVIPVPQPSKFLAGFFPKEYKINYDAGKDEYQISFSSLTKK